jgi:hypothetical protein
VVKGLLWRSSDKESEPSTALIVRAYCASGPCLILFFVLHDRRVVAVVPAQPSPFCLLAGRDLQSIVERILVESGFELRYRSACILSQRIIRDSIEETLKAMADYEIVKKLEELGS